MKANPNSIKNIKDAQETFTAAIVGPRQDIEDTFRLRILDATSVHTIPSVEVEFGYVEVKIRERNLDLDDIADIIDQIGREYGVNISSKQWRNGEITVSLYL